MHSSSSDAETNGEEGSRGRHRDRKVGNRVDFKSDSTIVTHISEAHRVLLKVHVRHKNAWTSGRQKEIFRDLIFSDRIGNDTAIERRVRISKLVGKGELL